LKVFTIFFLGRSTGDSVASNIKISVESSFVSLSFLLGKLNLPDFIKQSSIFLIILKEADSVIP
jgi:hypothetical protein